MELIFFLILSYVGMVLHFLKKIMKDGDESFNAIKNYFNKHPLSTIITFLAVTVTVVVLFFQMPEQLTFLSSLGLGYSGDSVMNKWEK